MSTPREWSSAFAQLAKADFAAWERLQRLENMPECHRLLFLQMCCEKLCKSHLLQTDNCEYPWEDAEGGLHSPLGWSFAPAQLLLTTHGRTRVAHCLNLWPSWRVV